MKRKFIIREHSFNDTIGGNIALHLLCRRLNDMGETAMMWPASRPVITRRIAWGDVVRLLRWGLKRMVRPPYHSGPFGNPVATRKDLDGAIVVYPEIVEGNPLHEPRVVRWLLHKPGHHTGKVVYGEGDLFFFYQEAFNDPLINPASDNRLSLTWFIEDYKQVNDGPRSGSAYLLKKGRGRPLSHAVADSILVDDLSHSERASVFNQVRYFYSYDLYSLYGLYAALCGCVPIVIPDPSLSKEDWTPDERDRYGIAYGVDDIPWAIATRDKLLARLSALRREEDVMLHDFVRKCREAFSS